MKIYIVIMPCFFIVQVGFNRFVDLGWSFCFCPQQKLEIPMRVVKDLEEVNKVGVRSVLGNLVS